MKVWVVITNGYEAYFKPIKIFSDKKRAEIFLENYKLKETEIKVQICEYKID